MCLAHSRSLRIKTASRNRKDAVTDCVLLLEESIFPLFLPLRAVGVDAPFYFRRSFDAFAADTEESAREGKFENMADSCARPGTRARLSGVQTDKTSIYCCCHEASTGVIRASQSFQHREREFGRMLCFIVVVTVPENSMVTDTLWDSASGLTSGRSTCRAAPCHTWLWHWRELVLTCRFHEARNAHCLSSHFAYRCLFVLFVGHGAIVPASSLTVSRRDRLVQLRRL